MNHLLIRNAEVVTASSHGLADVLVSGEKIVSVGQNLSAPTGARVEEAKGLFLFPGFIDPHTHIHLPFMGTVAKDTYESAGRAAAAGGTTTLFDFAIPERTELPSEAVAIWTEKSAGLCAIDHSFHLAVTHFDEAVEADLRALVKRGFKSFKVFLAYKGALGLSDAELYGVLKLAAELGVVVAAHCENETLVWQRQQELLAAGKTGPEWHHESRPPSVEASGVEHLCRFAGLTGASVYIVHLSCPEALEAALRARQAGVRVEIETLIQYLILDKSHAERPDFEGAKYVMSPPLRELSGQAKLWCAVADGSIGVVSTDHAPFDFATQKIMGRGDFTKIPNGIPALEERPLLLWSQGVLTGRIDPCRFVELLSTQAARTFGLFPKKGTLQPGADADLVIWDPEASGQFSASTQQSSVDYNAFEGTAWRGRPRMVFRRGECLVHEGEIVAGICSGNLLLR